MADNVPVDLFVVSQIDAAFLGALATPPAMTRLEPQSISGDPKPGVEARVADPLWMVGRQWQFGELLGEDTGSPVSVKVASRAIPITAWAPAGRMDGTDDPTKPDWRPWPEGAVLEELIEHVPRAGYERGLRWRAETGGALIEALREAGHDDAADGALTAYPLDLPSDPLDPTGTLDPAADRLLLGLAGSVPDGIEALEDLAAGTPGWLSGAADEPGARAVVDDWQQWVAGVPDRGGAWTTTRLEHRFWLRFGSGEHSVVVRSEAFGAGQPRWHHLEWMPDATVRLDGDDNLAGPIDREDVLLATPLRYPGMPADRYWQLEEGNIAIAAIETMVARYGQHIYSTYGFLDAFNPSFRYDTALKHGRVIPDFGWVAGDYLGIDQGPILAMIANFTDGTVWQAMSRSAQLRRGLQRAGFTGGWLEG